MKVETSKLQGKPLDYAVALSEGRSLYYYSDDTLLRDPWLTCTDGLFPDLPLNAFSPSTDWEQGGKRIEENKLCVGWIERVDDEGNVHEGHWFSDVGTTAENANDIYFYITGDNPLVVAMQCYVVSKLGAEVEIPDELLEV